MVLPSADAAETQHWSARDLRWVLSTAMERGAHLLTAGEHAVVRRIDALDDEVLEVYARLTQRRSAFQRAEALGRHRDRLHEAGLICGFVPWSTRAAHSTVAELKQGARELGLRRSGNRDALVERITPHTHWSAQRWVRVLHRALLRRLERWAFLRAWPDRSALVVERLGHVRWPAYDCTGGAALFPTRRTLRAWEQQLEACTPEERLAGLEAGHTAGPGRLDITRRCARHVLEEARELERSGALERARALYERLSAISPRYRTRALVRLARVIEQGGAPGAALDLLVQHRPEATGPDRMALNRAGRRLAKSLRRGWAPDRPLRMVKERSLTLSRLEDSGPRPRWQAGSFVEGAVIELLAEQGRVAHHVEGGLWRTLFALLFAPECYFAPVPGQLPVPRLPGPLDLGTPGFAARRPNVVAATRRAIANGDAGALVQRAYEKFGNQRLAGCAWATPEAHIQTVEVIGPALLLGVLDRVLAGGFKALSGLPDLLLMPGPEVRLPRGIPGRVGGGLSLVEIKSPSDTLSDAQRVWLDALSGITTVEVWRVRSAIGPETR